MSLCVSLNCSYPNMVCFSNILNVKHLFVLHIIILQYSLICSSYGLTSIENTEVIFVNVLARHGHRSPDITLPSSTNGDADLWPEGKYQLTNKGKREQYKFGEWLGVRYRDLLGNGYSSENIYILSTDTDRTLMSAQSCMAGLFPPTGKHVWNENLLWQPVPVHVVHQINDNLLTEPLVNCPKYIKILDNFYRSEEYRELKNKYSYLMDYIGNNTGKAPQDFYDLDFLFDRLESEIEVGLELAEWAAEIYPEPLFSASLYVFIITTYTEPMKRLYSGPLLKKMVDVMLSKSKAALDPDRNMFIYYGHDYNLAALLNTLGMYDWLMPPFSAALLIELRKDTKENFFITILYKNSTEGEEATLLSVPECGPLCPLDKFISLNSHHIPSDWTSECQINISSSSQYKTTGLHLPLLVSILYFLKWVFSIRDLEGTLN